MGKSGGAARSVRERRAGGAGGSQPQPNAGMGRTVTVADPRYAAVWTERVGRPLTMEEYANLAGAPPGARVEVGKGALLTARPRDGAYTHTVGSLAPDPKRGTGPGLLDFLFTDRHGSNAGAIPGRVVLMQARQARALGFSYIVHKSRANSRDAQQLPHLGYDAPVDEYLLTETRSKGLPPGVSGRMLSDVLATPAGRAWWQTNGMNPSLYIDLRAGSRSVRVLNQYAATHGLPPV